MGLNDTVAHGIFDAPANHSRDEPRMMPPPAPRIVALAAPCDRPWPPPAFQLEASKYEEDFGSMDLIASSCDEWSSDSDERQTQTRHQSASTYSMSDARLETSLSELDSFGLTPDLSSIQMGNTTPKSRTAEFQPPPSLICSRALPLMFPSSEQFRGAICEDDDLSIEMSADAQVMDAH
eukprot:TRINITY_DN917_c0_g1_i4.p1 TRINITY_DN917_c0_g1~~TRINITY_DN917_c0_g1_i4.p1  ORF type:complete len:179 (+),score=12.91 TRINITY_DN917_c0_g1_i4:186-722(+)